MKNAYTIGIRHLHSLPPGAFQLQVSDVFNFFEPNDYAWWRGDAVPGAVTGDLLPLLSGQPGPWAGHSVYLALFSPYDHPGVLALVHHAFPNAWCAKFGDSDNPAVFLWSCAIGAPRPHLSAEFEAGRGVRARYFGADSAELLLERVEPAIAFAFTPSVCRVPEFGIPCRAEWEGAWDVPAPGASTPRLQARSPAAERQLWIDGEVVDRPRWLPPGRHSLRARADFPGRGAVAGAQLAYQDPRTGAEDLVPLRLE